MDFTAEAAKLQGNTERQSLDPETGDTSTPELPTVTDLINYLTDNTDHEPTQIEEAATALQAEFPFLTDVSAHYLLGQRLGLNPAEAFGTKNHDTSLDISNIQPELVVTTTATIDRINLNDPDNEDWTRQDIWLFDDSGTIKLVLWNDDIRDDLSTGDDVELIDCWSKTYNGSVQLSLGKNGSINSQ